jgi:hypothetical protein
MSSHEDGDRAERYRARRMDYVFVGQLRMRDRESLWNALCHLPGGMQGPLYPGEPGFNYDEPIVRFETILRDVVSRLFVPLDDSPEEMNLTGPAWTQLPFRLDELLDEGPVGQLRRIGAVASNGLHTIRLTMMWRPENEPRPQVTQIRYIGPQHFHIMRHPARDVDQSVADVGYLMESKDIISVQDPADISALRAGADETEVEDLNTWTCGICSDGIDECNKLIAAHPAFVDANGKHVLHVFHRKCLLNLRRSPGPWSQLCPTCKKPLDPRPLTSVWMPRRTTLNARMGVVMAHHAHPYLVREEYSV